MIRSKSDIFKSSKLFFSTLGIGLYYKEFILNDECVLL